MRYILVIQTFFLISINSLSQSKAYLFVSEYDENVAKNHMQHLIKYQFVDGRMIAKDSIVSVPLYIDEETKASYIRFDLGQNRFYKNRYLISGIGNIIDIEKKKVLLDKQDPFVGFKGDSAIFYTNDIFKGKYYSIYNFKTGKYFKVEDPNFNPFPKRDVDFGISSLPFTINSYHVSGKKTVLVTDAGYGEANPEDATKVKQMPPILWLDDNKTQFIYANYSKDHKNATIYKVGLDKKVEKITMIDAIPPSKNNTCFQKDPGGNIIYSCGKGRFIIDLKTKTATLITFEDVGNGFAIEAKENETYGRKITFKTIEIGKKYCRFDNAKTALGYIAIETDMVVGGERYSQGISVWNASVNKWVRLKMFDVAAIVGWITE